ncbi:hypothetical protein BDV93DRAFT_560333 [Ceratobasidium sp. AG-I]|nr:hypothetical protein BDV93DRAFT_560333 [Ceratobasidium sp. AG-I]
MMFNLASLISAVVLALPLAVLAAPAFPSGAVVTTHVPQTSGRPRPSGVAVLEDRARSKTHKVTVGKVSKNGNPRFSPQYVKAKVGDTIKFEFYPSEHSVAETSFDAPCFGLDSGFNTGWISVSEDEVAHPPTRTLKVTSNEPQWFFSYGTYDCAGGMVFAVNPPKTGKTFKKFQDNALHTIEISVSEGKTSTRTITVTDKQPKWFYSSAGYDCTEGMVFAVNPPKSGNTFKKFQFWAIHAVE